MQEKKSKILLFTDSLGAGGAQRQLVGLASMLRHRGYDIEVVTYFKQDFYKSYLDGQNVKNICLNKAEHHFKRIPVLLSYIKKKKPDVVISFQETPSLIASLIKVLGGDYRLIVSERNTTQKIGFNERLRFFLYHWADAIVANSYAQSMFLSNRYQWMKSKLKTVVNFVDLNTYSASSHDLNEIPIIIVAASIWPPKNTIGFIEACKLLNEQGLRYMVEWYGLVDVGESYAKECLDLIKRYNLDNVKLLPKTKQIVDKYKNTDFFCLPSFYEGTPNVICEAIACGRPVLCSNVCDNSRYVVENINGYLFDPTSPEDIASKLRKALQICQIDYDRMCKNSRIIAESSFNTERFINEYENLINNNGK